MDVDVRRVVDPVQDDERFPRPVPIGREGGVRAEPARVVRPAAHADVRDLPPSSWRRQSRNAAKARPSGGASIRGAAGSVVLFGKWIGYHIRQLT